MTSLVILFLYVLGDHSYAAKPSMKRSPSTPRKVAIVFDNIHSSHHYDLYQSDKNCNGQDISSRPRL